MNSTYLAKSRLFDPKIFSESLARHAATEPHKPFKEIIERAHRILEQFHLRGASSQDLVNSRAWFIDRMIVEAWRSLWPEGVANEAAIVAVGGYGRGELNPCSDVDVLILLPERFSKDAAAKGESLVRFLWDIGLEVGSSVRTVSECVRQSKADVTIMTSLMESRLVFGSEKLFATMKKKTSSKRVWPTAAFLKAKIEEQIERHARFDDTAYNLEPNLKEGPGGLRDIQVISWTASKHFGVSSLKEVLDQDFLTEEEYRSLIRGRNFLWRVRNSLHFLAGRSEDRLLFDYQRQIAKQFGYRDRESNLAVEQLMKRYYRTVKEISLLNEILLQHLQDAVAKVRSSSTVEINRRFVAVDGFLDLSNSRVLSRAPFAILEAFLLLQQNPHLKGIRANTIRDIRNNLYRIDTEFRNDLRIRSLLMEILRQPHGHTHALRRMNAYGVLGALIPSFGRIVGQMQHDLFHVYTVDAHSLFVVRNVRRFALEKHADEFPHANELMGKVFKRERLYIAALFHDIAKGRGGDHSELGAVEAELFCRHHDMSDYDTALVAWLIKHHLLMSSVAQREDISDPEVVYRFASVIGDQEHLDHLYLLTIADMRGTSPRVWNSWKGRLLEELYHSTTRALTVGKPDAEELNRRVENRKHDATAVLMQGNNGDDNRVIDDESVERLWRYLGDSYFIQNDAQTLAWHASTITRARVVDLPIVSARHRIELGGIQCLVYAPESEELLPRTTAAFDRLNVDIVDANCYRARPGLSLYAFIILNRIGQNRAANEDLQAIERRIVEQLLSPVSTRQTVREVSSRVVRQFPIKTQVTFADSAVETTLPTAMEVMAQDRPGLLHQISLALLDCKVLLRSAKITTVGERVEDVFYITDRDGNSVNDSNQRQCLRDRILAALDDGTDSGDDAVGGLQTDDYSEIKTAQGSS